ncbi:PH domain-containing protein [Luteimonas sp. MC1828]|uniref:PH domain-containing protein n=1 Tax=Luteimonas sp. MC1828 TaxID=2799787 RepID=UPI0018F1D987|nr:PH domain-containing protein [Luteimonas sp. MC1828]MBJ7575767.1 PH domain-containing protein [Luteimonas sp. MC1828]
MTTTSTSQALAMSTPEVERRLHPWSWLFVLVQQLRQFIIPLLALVFVGRGDGNALWPLVGVAALALASLWQYFTYRYRVDDDRLVVREGLLERKVRQIPFARIHNVALHQSLLHRMFDVAEVRLESAAGGKAEAEMRVLRLDEALALERLIRDRGAATHAAGPAGTSADATAADPTLLLALPTAEVVRLGLASNRGMVVVAGAFALAWQVVPDRAMTRLVRDAGEQAFGYASHLSIGWAGQVAAVVGFVLLALVVMRLLSVLLAVLQFHGFTLQAHGRRLTVERGLLTRIRTSASRRRIQAWTLREGLPHRLLRRRALQVDTAVGQQQEGEQRSLRELAPIATPDACDALVREVLPGIAWPPAAWQPLHPRAWQRLMLPGVLVAAVAAAAAYWRFGPWGLAALAWAPWAVFAARQHARRAGYACDARLVAVREGWWSRHWRFAEIDKLQALELRQSPLDRRFGMATLWLDTAGAGAMSPPLRLRLVPLAEARALHARLVREVARRPLRW